MNSTSNISAIFPKHLFWDIDMNNLSIVKDKDVIIPRALFQSSKKTFNQDIKRLELFYSPKEIIECLKNTKERISNEVCLLVASKYKIPPFYRYTL